MTTSTITGTTTVQNVLNRAVAENGYPAMFAEIRDGKQTWFGSAGTADLSSGRAPRQGDQFRIGSVTKTFTATIVLQLAAEYRLSLDDTVDKWLPGLVRGNGHDGTRIAIRHLLGHTSGIFGYTLDKTMIERFYSPAMLEHRFDVYRPDQLIDLATSNPADFEPGTEWGYSNTNFVLAAMIIERVTGQTYADVLDQRIARPLGLTDTYAPSGETQIRGPHGRAYSKLMLPDTDAPVHDVTDLSATYGFGVGELISTATDLNTFLGALLSGRLLPPTQLDEMLTMTPVPDGKWLDGYSYGLGISSVKLPDGTTVYGHGGMITGTWSYLFGTRDGQRLVTQNVNGDWGMPPLDIFPELLAAAFPAQA
ncbi:serine hydrolase domain-containing protein [Nocardia sp. NPDC051052]|uniref:serine hydrolase domain-containing protein n=1 Tax=Nocardia sp. NPDC051052 TaxID=3364322 RepID=UPI0037B2F431